MGRPNKGLGHVDGLQGDCQSKDRLRSMLGTICGLQSVEEACAELGLRRSQFQDLRTRALAGALAALVPRQGGRRRLVEPLTLDDLEALQQRNVELERELVLLRAQLELAMTMPELVQDELPSPKRRAKGSRAGH